MAGREAGEKTIVTVWEKYVAATKFFDKLYSEGVRCPTSALSSRTPNVARCTCQRPTEKICLTWKRIEELATEIGEPVSSLVGGMD